MFLLIVRIFEYPFFSFPSSDILQPYLPITIINPETNVKYRWDALIDTGADSCLFNKTICELTDHEFNGAKVKTFVCQGISSEPIITFVHTFQIELRHPENSVKEPVWQSEIIEIECGDYDKLPILLGTTDFLKHFKITLDYPNNKTIIEIKHEREDA
ncbi:MAG: hypothetical protein IPO21_08095 [Bacteroidales bacterium]|nr:hypothetical protein [Bacteroidales bacterium]